MSYLENKKKEAAKNTLEKLRLKEKDKMNPLLHLFHLKKIRNIWIHLKRPFSIIIILIIIWKLM